MTSYSIEYTREDELGQPHAEVQYHALPNDNQVLDDIEAYADFLQGYSDAKITLITITYGRLKENAQGSGDYDSLGLKAKIFMRNTQTEKLTCQIINSPRDFMFDTEQRILPNVGQRIAEEFSNLTGVTHTFEHGALVGCTEHV